MAFTKPEIHAIVPDICSASVYIRSVKKFGKTTLFRDVIMEKFGDPAKGLLVEIGAEHGDTMLDNVNSTHVDTYKDFDEMKTWLIEQKGKEHDIKIVCFDVVDEMVPVFDKEIINRYNKEKPAEKPMVKSIKAAYGGYTAGEQMSADLIKRYCQSLRAAGFQIWALGHSKLKNIKDKANVDSEGYQQLTSNLAAQYEAVFGDIFDIVATGVIDKDFDVVTKDVAGKKKEERHVTDTVRKLYFRGTPEIDAGGRFAAGSVPEYLVFDKPNMAADFIKVCEEGMAKSRTGATPAPAKKKVEKAAPVAEKKVEEVVDDDAPVDEAPEVVDDAPFDVDTPVTEDELRNEIRAKFKDLDKEVKAKVKEVIKNAEGGTLDTINLKALKEIKKMIDENLGSAEEDIV